MSKAYLQLGKLGDVISILGILYHEFQATGQKQFLVVGREFASVLEGVSYVEPVIWKGAAGDLAGAILFAKKRYSQLIVLQTWADNIQIRQTTPSFQLDQWQRAGCAEHFYEWPLVFDQRDITREPVNLSPEPYILYGDHSQSSPFLHKEELAAMLKAEFPKHRIIRLSEIRVDRFFDLLGLFDRAAALVTVETAHVHLSKASPVPTFVLAANGWRGSAWHPKFKLHMRYAAWERRKDKFIDAVRRTVNGEPEPFQVEKMGTLYDHGYNPSIVQLGDQVVGTYRYHDRGDWRTTLAFHDGEKTVKLQVPQQFRNYSHEDARCFVLNGNLHAAYVVAIESEKTFRSVVAYGEIRDGKLDCIQVQYPGNDFSGLQKNWLPFVRNDVLYFVHGIKGGNQIVLRVDYDRVRSEHLSPGPGWSWGEIRGGAIVPHAGKLLRFFHSRIGEHAVGKYFIGAALMESEPPFKTVAVSTKPIIEGDERWTPNCKHWKQNVAFPLGCVARDGKFLLSFGRNDSEACVAELSYDNLFLP